MTESPRRLVLASASQGRRELLEEAGFEFEIRVAPEGAEEAALEAAAKNGAGPEELGQAAAGGKAEAVAATASPGEVIVAADTLVRAVDGEVLGKGSNAEESKAILFISSELPELFGITDRILVMRRGRLVGNLTTSDTTQEEVMHLAAVEETK